jgi:protein gp37
LVGDMGDMLGAWVPRGVVLSVLNTVRLCPDHDFLFLTKNPAGYAEFEWTDNCWLGTTVEDQATAAARLPNLLTAGSENLWISYEPGLGPVDVTRVPFPSGEIRNVLRGASAFEARVRWIVAGGQTGPDSCPMHPDWVRGLRDACQEAGTPFFFKAWGDWWPAYPQYGHTDSYERFDDLMSHPNYQYDANQEVCLERDGGMPVGSNGDENWSHYQPMVHLNPWWMLRVGAKEAGRTLDGRIWEQLPAD